MLLTSPPLTASNLKESIKSVRLACLMCAASVNPEPGSNSLINCIYTVFLQDLTYRFDLVCLHTLALIFTFGFLQILV